MEKNMLINNRADFQSIVNHAIEYCSRYGGAERPRSLETRGVEGIRHKASWREVCATKGAITREVSALCQA